MGLFQQTQSPKLYAMNTGIQQIEIRQANETEIGIAFSLVEEYFKLMGVVAREEQGAFKLEYFGARRGFWLARTENELVGCVGLRTMKDVRSAEIKRMYVREKWRGKGIAQKLLSTTEEFALNQQYEWICLDTTDEMQAAARLYARNGYERCERYNNNPQATIFMKKNLASKKN